MPVQTWGHDKTIDKQIKASSKIENSEFWALWLFLNLKIKKQDSQRGLTRDKELQELDRPCTFTVKKASKWVYMFEYNKIESRKSILPENKKKRISDKL